MWKDPIVEEVRKVRQELAAEAGGDLHEICKRLRQSEKEHRKNKPKVAKNRKPPVQAAVPARV